MTSCTKLKKLGDDQVQWSMPGILATGEAEIKRTAVQGYPDKRVGKTSSQPVKTGHDGLPVPQLCWKHE
jgi:hypothetical protein